jgi:K+-transporting ATPase KdpF subunit
VRRQDTALILKHTWSASDVHAVPSRPSARGDQAMSALLLWLLIVAIAIYLVVAMLRPDKF